MRFFILIGLAALQGCEPVLEEATITPSKEGIVEEVPGVVDTGEEKPGPELTTKIFVADFGDAYKALGKFTISIGDRGNTLAFIDTEGVDHGLKLSFEGFNGQNTDGHNAQMNGVSSANIADSFYGNDVTFQGASAPRGKVILEGLSQDALYDIGLYASRMGVEDSRETLYIASGQNEGQATLEVANNMANIAQLPDIVPDQNGKIIIEVMKGPSNSNHYGFYYLGALKLIEKSKESESIDRPPEISFRAPQAGARIELDGALDVEFSASDANNDPLHVELYIDGRKFVDFGSAPYRFTLTDLSTLGVGAHKLEGRVSDGRYSNIVQRDFYIYEEQKTVDSQTASIISGQAERDLYYAAKVDGKSPSELIRMELGDGDYVFGHYQYRPRGYEDPENARKKWPLVVFLPGIGERGNQTTELGRIIGSGKGLFGELKDGREMPAVGLALQTSNNFPPDKVQAMIDYMVKKYRIDLNRIYMTGLSYGGGYTWKFLDAKAKTLAGAAPICPSEYIQDYTQGGSNPDLTKVPIWGFHACNDSGPTGIYRSRFNIQRVASLLGMKDPENDIMKAYTAAWPGKYCDTNTSTNAPDGTGRLVNGRFIWTSGVGDGSHKSMLSLTAYQTGGHGIWSKTYRNEALYRWLFSKTKSLHGVSIDHFDIGGGSVFEAYIESLHEKIKNVSVVFQGQYGPERVYLNSSDGRSFSRSIAANIQYATQSVDFTLEVELASSKIVKKTINRRIP